MSAAGDAEPEALAVQPLPFTLAEIVRRQLDGLSGDERRVIDAAAVLGRGASFDVLAAVTRMNEQELIGHLRGLVDRGLITEDRPDEFVFRHALVRDAVEDQLLGRERRRLHEAALAALRESASADIAGLAKHALGAGRYDEFLDLAQEGATYYLERGSSYQALRLATDALVEDPDCLTLLGTATRAAWLVGLNDEAFGHARRWRERAEARGDLAAQAEAAHMLTRLVRDLARVDELDAALADLEHLTTRLPAGPERARAYAAVAQAHMLAHRSELAVEWSDRAIEEAERWDAKPVRALAMVEKGSALAGWAGHRDEALVTIREAVAEAEAVGDHVAVARGLHNMLECVSLHTREGKAIVVGARFGRGARRLRRDDPHQARGPAGRDRDQRRRHGARRLGSTAGFGASARSRRARRNGPSSIRCRSGWKKGARRKQRHSRREQSTSRAPTTRGSSRSRCSSRSAPGTATKSSRCSVAWAMRAMAKLFSPNVEWTALPVDAALRAGVAPAVVRDVLGPMQSSPREAPWFPLGEAMVVAAEGDHRKALEQLDLVLTHPEPEVPAYVLAAAWFTAGALSPRARRRAPMHRTRRLALVRSSSGGRATDETRSMPSSADPSGPRAQEDGDLTTREREVAGLVARGPHQRRDRQAALHLAAHGRGPRVEHPGQARLASRSELTAWAVRSGLAAANE